MRLKAVLEYDGTDYYGFQVQPNRRTIQGTLESALEHLTRQRIRVVGAGRTDAGVHAVGQVVHFDTDWRHPLEEMEKGLNALLPRDIAVRALEAVSEGFHARYSAVSRTYRYVILNRRTRSPVLGRFMHHVPAPLDLSAMQESGAYLLGTRDYAAFGQPTVGPSTMRTIYRAEWSIVEDHLGWPGSVFLGASERELPPSVLYFEIEANSYLRGMVRRLVGTMLWVGMGRLSVEGFREIVDCADIARAAPPAPACGLCLVEVKY